MFAFILAGHLKMTVETLMETMTWHEFVTWQQFYKREPFGTLAEDQRAVLYSGIKINSYKKPGAALLNALHLLPWRHPDAHKPKPEPVKLKGRKGLLAALRKKLLGKGEG